MSAAEKPSLAEQFAVNVFFERFFVKRAPVGKLTGAFF